MPFQTYALLERALELQGALNELNQPSYSKVMLLHREVLCPLADAGPLFEDRFTSEYLRAKLPALP